MYEIKVVNPCSCAKKRKAWSKEFVFESFEEAQKVASQMVQQGNEKFCKRHEFLLKINNKTIEIETQIKPK